MQKKIIALAIASALTAPAMALADATVYGLAALSIDMAKDGAATNSTSANQLVSNNSRIGFKSSEDLGGGLSTILQMEGTVGLDVGTTGTSLFNRNTFLGLKSNDMGTLILGRHDTPYKIATRKLDVFGDTIAADNRNSLGVGMMGWGVADARLGNVIAYVSPSLSGLTIAAASVFGAETLPQPAAPNNKKGTAMSLAGMYDNGPIYAALGYQTIKFGNNSTGDLAANTWTATLNTALAYPANTIVLSADDKLTTTKLGGSYKMDAFMLGAVIENMTFKAAAGGDVKSTNLYLSGKFNVSSTDAVKFAYTSRGETESAGVKGQDKATSIAVGYDHAMSKATTVYALYSKVTQDVGTTDADPSALSFGMKYAF
ncbi:MAG: porin [Gallionella sp.]|nr:porin [Gallionella sp.]